MSSTRFGPDPFRGGVRPSVRCHWQDCDGRAFRCAEVSLMPVGSGVARMPRSIPFCEWHMEIVARAATDPGLKIRLGYHPDDVAPEGYEFL